MKWIWILLVIALLAGGGFWYYAGKRAHIAQEVDTCMSTFSELQKFMVAMKSGNPESCEGIGSYKNRCLAFLSNNPELCGEKDNECVTIASKNASRCNDVTCRALVANDPAICEEAEGIERQECLNHVTFNADAFKIDAAKCEELVGKVV